MIAITININPLHKRYFGIQLGTSIFPISYLILLRHFVNAGLCRGGGAEGRRWVALCLVWSCFASCLLYSLIAIALHSLSFSRHRWEHDRYVTVWWVILFLCLLLWCAVCGYLRLVKMNRNMHTQYTRLQTKSKAFGFGIAGREDSRLDWIDMRV